MEFSDSGTAKDELLKNFDRAIETVVATLTKQSDNDWAAPYSAELKSKARNRFNAFLRCAGHAYHHVGQIIYLQKGIASANQRHKRVSGGSPRGLWLDYQCPITSIM